jgi:hypothetical protein
MNFDVQLAHSVTEIGQPAWDRLNAGRPFSSYRWYQFGEAVLSDCHPTYILLACDGQAVAQASFWLKHREWLPFSSTLLLYGAERMLQKRPLFMCAAPLASAPALVLPEPPLREAALETIARLALQLGREQKASLTFFGYTPTPIAQEKSWPDRYSPVSLSNTDTSLEIAWPDFDSYLKHLAQSTRRNVRLHDKQAAEMGVVVSTQSEVPDPGRAFELIQAVESHHHMSHRPWTRSVLENVRLVDSTWVAARIGNKLVGCCLLVGDGHVQSATLLGLDYSIPQSIYIYYQVMYAAVRYAIESKASVLYGGDGAYEFKRRLGFRKLPEDYMLIATDNLLLRFLIRSMARQTKIGPEEPVDSNI